MWEVVERRWQTQDNDPLRPLRHIKPRTRKILEQVIITDKAGKILYVNKEVEDITGYSVEEVLGKSPSLWGGQMPKKFYKQMWDTLLTQKETVSLNITNKHKSGRLYKVNLTISPVLDTTGEVVFLVGMEKLIPETEK